MVANRISHRAELVRHLQPLPHIMARQGRLAQVVMNLLVNAADAVEDAGPGAHRITISTRHDGDSIYIDVADTGNGIPDEVRSRVFDQFFTTKAPSKGTGLGLSLCADIVEQHGGTLTFESELGVGTTFSVRVPTGSRQRRADLRAEARKKRTPGAGARILLVDDEPLVLKSTQRSLSPHHDVTGVRGGEQALDILRSNTDFDLVLCDMMMPGVDGVDVYEYLRDNAPQLADRMVFCTGGVFTQRFEQLLESTNNLIIHKPIDVDELRALVAEFIEQHGRRSRDTASP